METKRESLKIFLSWLECLPPKLQTAPLKRLLGPPVTQRWLCSWFERKECVTPAQKNKKQKTAMLRFYCRRTWHSAGGLHMRNHAKKESLAHTEVNYAHILYPPRRWNARKTKTQTKWHNPYWSEITNPPTTSQDAPGKSQSIPPKPHLAPSWPQTDSHREVWPPCFVTTSCRWGSL